VAAGDSAAAAASRAAAAAAADAEQDLILARETFQAGGVSRPEHAVDRR